MGLRRHPKPVLLAWRFCVDGIPVTVVVSSSSLAPWIAGLQSTGTEVLQVAAGVPGGAARSCSRDSLGLF